MKPQLQLEISNYINIKTNSKTKETSRPTNNNMQLNLLYNVIANNKELAILLNKCNIKFSILFRIPSQVDHFPSAVIINNGTIFYSD